MALPPQDGSLSSAVPEASPLVAPRTDLEYQPMRVLMSVLLSPQAPTRIRTSPGAGSGRG